MNYKFEVKRKMFHSLLLIPIITYIILFRNYGQNTALISVDILLVAVIIFESLRTTKVIKSKFADSLLRKTEQKNKLSAMVPMVAGMVLCFALFNIQLAIAALFMSVFGDMTAALVGSKYGKKKLFDNKTYTGTFVGLAVNLVLGIILVSPLVGIPMAIVASAVELISSRFDNLLMPLAAGLTGYLILLL